jgi:hypothetical protein
MIVVLLVVACDPQAESVVALPTPANPDAVRTAIVRTQNAPPTGFESIGFNPIDFNRDSLPSAYFEVTITFSGQYTETGEDAASSLVMEVWENNLLRQRRVVLRFLGEALSGGVTRLEAVRFENDFYILDSNNICTKNNQAAQEIGNLTAGRLVGGFTLAVPSGRVSQANGFEGYQYEFAKQDLVLNIFRETPSAVEVTGGEAWLLPDYGVIARFGASMNVHNAKILFGETPVTGGLRYEYNLLEIGQETNITLPNGC